jgi:hypothetical protein
LSGGYIFRQAKPVNHNERPMKSSKWKWATLSVILVLAGLVGGLLLYVQARTLRPQPQALAALQSSDEVTVTTNKWLVFSPTNVTPDRGLIFYPGGFVDPRAYAPQAHDIAAAGYQVVIVPMPLNLAVLGVGRASEVVTAFPDINRWAIGGHSLGASMATQFMATNPEVVSGLVLWAGYPPTDVNLSTGAMPVTSVYGTQDGLVSATDLENSQQRLPANTTFVAIVGGNHAQFGWYGPQKGDLPATISPEEQQVETVSATVELLQRLVVTQ